MKIVIDLQCCQTEARSRGIGRYSLALTREIVRLGPQHDFIFLLNQRYLEKSATVISALAELGRLGATVCFDYPEVGGSSQERFLRESVACALRRDRIETLSPDLYHASSLFEGESVYGAAPAFIDLPRKPIINSATIYDLVPLLFEDVYLTDPTAAAWYRRTAALLPGLDVGLAISDATKRDAERLLRMDPARVVNIFGAVDDAFRAMTPQETREIDLSRHGVDRPFLLYVGGPDFRKNLDGAIAAFAEIDRAFPGRRQFVVVYDMGAAEAARLQAKARELGLAESLVLTGHVSDDDLAALYNRCELFVFPSLYEGLGLPVIEAMRCGAPVLVGDNSSLVEIVADPAQRVDAADPKAIAAAALRLLETPGALARAGRDGLARAQSFTWENSARAALAAWEEAYARRTPRSRAGAKNAPRIAMFTPLPPTRSGIADYSADFLPHLAKHAGIDVYVEDVIGVPFAAPGVELRHRGQFELHADQYDAIVYQLGNSPYHHYMLPLTAAYPGVVVLHDVCLGHLSHDPADPDAFLRQAISDHGGAARSVVEASETPAAARAIIDRLSCCATPAQRSHGVIVHSDFARELLRADVNGKIAPQIAVVPQFRALPAPVSPAQKAAARKRLGLGEGVVVVAAFGHVAETKGVVELIEGFGRTRAAATGAARLVFVGELEGGPQAATPYARKVLKALEGRDVLVTGYVDQDRYEDYLRATDIGVQLRTVTRGETSRAMLDVLASGAALVHNRFAASAEIPSQAALALDDCDPAGVARAIDALVADPALRGTYGAAGRDYVARTRDPDAVAREFVETVLAMSARAHACGPQPLANAIGRIMRNAPATDQTLAQIAHAYVAQERTEDRPRILMDVTHIRERDLGTGVQRVVREATRRLYRMEDATWRAQAFAFRPEGLEYADDFAQACGARLAVETPAARSGPLDLRPFDRMLLADGDWHLTRWMRNPLKRLNALGGGAFGLVHDILPLRYPEFFPNHVREALEDWLSLMTAQGAGLLCTSRTGMDDLSAYLRERAAALRPGFRIGYARLGADFATLDAQDEIAPRTRDLAARRNLFVMVGTVEPRKGHDCVLDAFERLWANGRDATLVVAGKIGWGVEALAERLGRHPQRDRRLFHLGFAPDADLRALYGAATAAIVASRAEGFGLPIYEAAHYGAPLVLSDLPIFRELAGEHARYFRPGDASALAAEIERGLTRGFAGSQGVRPRSWRDFMEDALAFLNGRDPNSANLRTRDAR